MTYGTRNAPPPGARHLVPQPGEADATAGSGRPKTRVPSAGTAGAVPRGAAAIPYLAVLACAAAGLYVSWRQGSRGGGQGGAIAGSALLVAAGVRLMLPARLAGLLAARRRVTDVLTLTAFGTGLLVVGLVLPRLGPLSVPGRMAGPR